MKFEMTIDMSGALFAFGPEKQLIEILEQVGDQLYEGLVFGTCEDATGKEVGTWSINNSH